MARLEESFAQLKAKGQKALVVYLTAGDPTLDESVGAALAAVRGGADILEIGVPFSDPIADGAVIQRAMGRALVGGGGFTGALEVVRRVRQSTAVPIVLFGYLNPILWKGAAASCAEAASAGADGLLVVDSPPEESAELLQTARTHGLSWVSLIAPTTGSERAARIAKDATGFLYLVSMTGVTGGALADPRRLGPLVAELRRACDLPVCIGFGIRDAESARAAAGVADGVVVGSAIVAALEKGGPKAVERLVAELRLGIGGP
jgi:tryptophan synthase alpha chain